MARFRLRWLVLACCLVLPAAFAAPKGDLTELRGRIEALQKELEGAEESRQEAADALRSSERDISEINRRLFDLQRQQAGLASELARLEAERVRSRKALSSHQDALGQLLYRHYLAGRQDQLKILLENSDPNVAARRLGYYAYVARARAETITRFRLDLKRLDELKVETEQKNNELVQVKAEQGKERNKLLASQNERRRVFDRLARQINDQRREIGQLQRDERRLARLVERLGRILPKPPAPVARKPAAPGAAAPPPEPTVAGAVQALKGRLLAPMRGAAANRYGAARADTGTTWKGLFYRSTEGEPVKAVADGRVVFADWLRGFGNLVIVDHGGGLMSLYGNTQSVYKQVGEPIRAGETVAAAGNSGGNADPGLYFELRYQSRTIDPKGWMAQ